MIDLITFQMFSQCAVDALEFFLRLLATQRIQTNDRKIDSGKSLRQSSAYDQLLPTKR